MRLGILSDSHGRHRAVREALGLFDRLGVEYVIHCGDVGGRHVFDEMVGRPCAFVWGNTDIPGPGLLAYLQIVGLRAPVETPTLVRLAGKQIAVYHGHEDGFETAPQRLDVDYLLHGHTHVARDEHVHGLRIINPGALHRARRKTVAVLDLESDQLDFHEIHEG